jgi:hypothetical protein
MLYKTLHMVKRTGTNNDLQNTTHGQKNRYKQCYAKHYTWLKEQVQAMIYKTLHMAKITGTNNALQNTMHGQRTDTNIDLQNTTHGQKNRYKQ